MKLEYTKPELEIDVFETVDVITLSETDVQNDLDYENLFPNT